MPATPSFYGILLACALYGALHSTLASPPVKAAAARAVGRPVYHRFYRLFFSIMAALTLLPLLALVAWLPDRRIYAIPAPWADLTLLLQAAAVVGVLYTVLQTGALRFVGLRQTFERDPAGPSPEKLVLNGLYRWARHPIYTATLVFLWLTPVMTWNILALNIGLSTYMVIGSIFEEQKLVAQFGQAYQDYRRRTPRIIPRISK